MRRASSAHIRLALLGAVLVGQACGSSTLTRDAAAPGGGGAVTAGGATGTGGGSPSSTGGASGTGGVSTAGGQVGTGGAPGTGGSGTGGTDVTSVDAATVCSCDNGKLSWDCFCRAFDCSKTLDAYAPNAGSKYGALMEYADCDLVVVWSETYYPMREEYFDRSTGKLVGEHVYGPAGVTCPFTPDAACISSFQAGRSSPDSNCIRTKCVEVTLKDACMPAGSGSRDRG